MAASEENWNEWDAAVADGIETCPWEEQLPAHVQAWVRASARFSRQGKGPKRKTKTKPPSIRYNFCRPQASLSKCTPAMVAGISTNVWSIQGLITGVTD